MVMIFLYNFSIDVEVGTTMVKVDLKAGFYYYISQEVFQATVGDSLFFAIVGPGKYIPSCFNRNYKNLPRTFVR